MTIHNLTIRAFALAAILCTSACDTDEDYRPAVSSTTTTEETTVSQPMRGASSTETTTTLSR